jgi:hypothetical protein
MFHSLEEKSPSVGAAGDKTSRWDYRERCGYNQWQKVREEWDNLDRIKTFLALAFPIYGMECVEV